MPTTRTWRVAAGVGTAAALLAGLGATASASDGLDLRDRGGPVTVDPVNLVDDSAESADSANESPFDSAQSAADSPGDPNWKDPSPESADSPGASAADSPAPVKKKKPPVTKKAPAADSGDSADSPAPVRKKTYSGNSGNSGGSAGSGGSADSA